MQTESLKNKSNICLELIVVLALFVLGALIRIRFFDGISADTRSFIMWFDYVRSVGNLSAIGSFIGDYNVPYVAVLFLASFLPFETLTSVKILAAVFDLLGIVCGFIFARGIALETGEGTKEARYLGELGAALIWLSPIVIGNSAFQGQLEALWTFTGFLALYFAAKKHPVIAMIFFGISFAMKPQGIFFLPALVLIIYQTGKFSVLYFLIIPVVIQILCIPSMIAGNSFFFFWEHFFSMTGLCPYLYYYYPNVWIWMRNLPYYAFGKVGIGIMLSVFVIYTVRFVKDCRDRTWTLSMFLELSLWALMTCPMFLPAMHERYNYPAECFLPVLAIFNRRYRIPAAILVVSGFLCNAFAYYGWGYYQYYGLSALNIIVYIYLTLGVIGMFKDNTEKGGQS